jgi:hypothetical protein
MSEIDTRFLLCFLKRRDILGGAAVVQTQKRDPPPDGWWGCCIALMLAPGCKARISRALGSSIAHILILEKQAMPEKDDVEYHQKG